MARDSSCLLLSLPMGLGIFCHDLKFQYSNACMFMILRYGMKEVKAAPKIDYAALKFGGIIMQKDDDFFAVRLRLPGGCISADQLPKIADVAKKYGRGMVRLTARQGVEIPWIEFKKIEAAIRDLADAGISLGSCGPRFRAVTACPGSPVCRQGRCIRCGNCIDTCLTDAWKTERKGYAVFAGGKMGRHPQLGEKIADFVSEDQGLKIIQSCLDFYIRHGNKRERFGDLMRRVGVERLRDEVLQQLISRSDL